MPLVLGIMCNVCTPNTITQVLCNQVSQLKEVDCANETKPKGTPTGMEFNACATTKLGANFRGIEFEPFVMSCAVKVSARIAWLFGATWFDCSDLTHFSYDNLKFVFTHLKMDRPHPTHLLPVLIIRPCMNNPFFFFAVLSGLWNLLLRLFYTFIQEDRHQE